MDLGSGVPRTQWALRAGWVQKAGSVNRRIRSHFHTDWGTSMTATLPGTSSSLDTGVRPGSSNPLGSEETIIGEGRQEWVAQARCKDIDPDELFVRGAAQRKAASICRHCPVLLQCRADALDNRVEFGVWGGMTERQRRALLKQHPEVRSWADFFAQQIERHTAVY